jgi:hypothetical protein
MPLSVRVRLVTVVAACLYPATLGAQLYETVGTRAQGMAGAFVAVADDATAAWWNPAGLATGAVFSTVLEQVRLGEPSEPANGGPAWRTRARGFAASFPALALSHYRLRISEIAALPEATEDGAPGRQDEETPELRRVRAIAANHFGVTVGQSIGSRFVVATTVKIVRAGQRSSDADGSDLLKRTEGMDVRLHTSTDLDLGAMATLGPVRLGVSVRNVREPRFGRGDETLKLKRQARIGAAVFSDWRGGTVTVAADADLTRTAAPIGQVRHVAAGAEAWLFNRRLGLRGGASANTVGEGGQSASGGVSIALRPGLYLEAAMTGGSEQGRSGWALGLGAGF